MRLIITILLLSLSICSFQIPGNTQSQSILLKNGVIHTISDSTFVGDILFKDGIITELGVDIINNDAMIFDIKDLHIYPGFISASTTLGLVEINAVRATRDYNETGFFNPNVRTERAYNPDSESIPITRSNGILLAHVVPKGGRISGSSSVMMLDGWTWEDCILSAPTGVHINWPRMNITENHWDKKSSEEKRKNLIKELESIDQYIYKTKAYLSEKEIGALQGTDMRWEAMIPVVKKQIPLFIHANKISQITNAIDFSKKHNIKMVLVGGTDSWLVTELLRENDIPVIYEHPFSTPSRRWEPYTIKYDIPHLLHEAGVRFCIAASSSSFQAPHQRNLPYEAAIAISYGLDKSQGLRSITLSAAEILGIDDRVGSIEIGKDATFFIADGDPLLHGTDIKSAFIMGKTVDLNDRHKTLNTKYREKYKQLGLIK